MMMAFAKNPKIWSSFTVAKLYHPRRQISGANRDTGIYEDLMWLLLSSTESARENDSNLFLNLTNLKDGCKDTDSHLFPKKMLQKAFLKSSSHNKYVYFLIVRSHCLPIQILEITLGF